MNFIEVYLSNVKVFFSSVNCTFHVLLMSCNPSVFVICPLKNYLLNLQNYAPAATEKKDVATKCPLEWWTFRQLWMELYSVRSLYF